MAEAWYYARGQERIGPMSLEELVRQLPAQGLLFATVTGPGEVWLQSLPFSRMAGKIMAASGGGKEEGSILGNVGGLISGD
jgi:hypothetical protein